MYNKWMINKMYTESESEDLERKLHLEDLSADKMMRSNG